MFFLSFHTDGRDKILAKKAQKASPLKSNSNEHSLLINDTYLLEKPKSSVFFSIFCSKAKAFCLARPRANLSHQRMLVQIEPFRDKQTQFLIKKGT